MTFSLSGLIASLLNVLRQPLFWLIWLAGTALGIGMQIDSLVLPPILPSALFSVGVVVGYIIIATHEAWLPAFIRLTPGLKNDDLPSISAVRSPMILLVLPVLAIFLLMSSSPTIGHGTFWGVFAWYSAEIIQMLRGNLSTTQKYFPRLQRVEQDDVYHGVVWGFLLAWLLYSLGLIWLK